MEIWRLLNMASRLRTTDIGHYQLCLICFVVCQLLSHWWFSRAINIVYSHLKVITAVSECIILIDKYRPCIVTCTPVMIIVWLVISELNVRRAEARNGSLCSQVPFWGYIPNYLCLAQYCKWIFLTSWIIQVEIIDLTVRYNMKFIGFTVRTWFMHNACANYTNKLGHYLVNGPSYY